MNVNKPSRIWIAVLSLLAILMWLTLFFNITGLGNSSRRQNLDGVPSPAEQIDMILLPQDLVVILDPDDRIGKSFISR